MGSAFGGGARNTYNSAVIAQQGAAQQAAANREAAIAGTEMSLIDQYTPFGNAIYTSTGNTPAGNPRYRLDQTYDPATQRALESQKRTDYKTNELAESQADRAAALLGTNADLSDANIQARTQSMINPRLEQRFGQDEDRLRTQLVNRGVREGSQAFNDAMLSFNQGKTDAFTQEGLANRQQAIQEIVLPRNQTLNEISSLLGTQQIGQPQFVSTPRTQVQAADYQGAANQTISAMNAAEQRKSAALGGLFGALGQLGGAAIGAAGRSDRRVKRDVVRIGQLDNGIPIYRYRYVGGGDVLMGVMAQDVERVLPEAVKEIGGVKHVDYAMAAGWKGSYVDAA